MTTARGTALQLRLAITDAYAGAEPPPGVERAVALVRGLKRAPTDAEAQRRARDLLAVLDLRARLIAHRERAERAGAANLALVVHGLVGHADAELLGATRDPGWRAAALDLLDPDGEERDPLDPTVARHLLALALGFTDDDERDETMRDESEHDDSDNAPGE